MTNYFSYDESAEDFSYDERAEAIMERVESLIAAGLGRARLSNEADISINILEQLLARKKRFRIIRKDETPAETLNRLAAWLNEADKAAPKSKALANTPTYQRITGLLAHAHASRGFIAITGDVGIGKTEAARHYAATHPRTNHAPGAVYVRFTKTDTTEKYALQNIAAAILERGNIEGRPARLLDDLCASLKRGDMLILDECNHLSSGNLRTLDVIRDIHDGSPAAVTMLGNPDMRANVYDGREGFSALASRVLHFALGHTTEGDVDEYLQWAGITGKSARAVALQIAARPGQNGGLRSLAKVIENIPAFFPDNSAAKALPEMARMIGRL